MSEVIDPPKAPDAEGDNNKPAVPSDAALALREHMVKLTATADDVDVPEKVLQSILRATTAEGILNAGASMPAEQVLNMPMTVRAIRASESTQKDGADYYLHVDATLLGNGDEVTFSCGSSDVCMKLVALDMNGMLPVNVKITRAERPTKNGNFPLFLRALGPDEAPF